jgi:hypothetical protein
VVVFAVVLAPAIVWAVRGIVKEIGVLGVVLLVVAGVVLWSSLGA